MKPGMTSGADIQKKSGNPPITSATALPPGHDAAAAHRIILLLDRLGRLCRELQFVDGLNPAQWEAMRYLDQANHRSRTPSCLAEYLGATKGTVSQTLIALEGKGLITRCKGGTDKRQVELCLTEPGRELLKKDPMRTLETAAGEIATDCGDALVRGLSRLLFDLQNHHNTVQFGVCQDCSLFCLREGEAEPDRCGLTGADIPEGESAKLCAHHRNEPAFKAPGDAAPKAKLV